MEQKIKPIPPLQIGDGKLKPRIESKSWFKLLTNWFIGVKVNW
jgi:hypothetical protein